MEKYLRIVYVSSGELSVLICMYVCTNLFQKMLVMNTRVIVEMDGLKSKVRHIRAPAYKYVCFV